MTTDTLTMGTFSLGRVAALTGGELAGDADAHPERLTTDSRLAGPGVLFVALVGERFDANDFVAQVAEAGALGAVVSRRDLLSADWPDGFSLVLVEDTLAALQAFGRGVWDAVDEAGARTVALTGSNGKTTTKEILRALWAAHGPTWATQGNYNNHIGVPLTLCAAPVGVESLIVEMGANQPRDIGQLIELAPGDLRIITSIGHAHIEGFGGLDGVRRTKGELLNGATARTVGVVPWHERDALVPDGWPGRVVTFGTEEGGEVGEHVRAEVVGARGAGLEVRLVFTRDGAVERDVTVRTPLHGVHNATNLAAALATLWVEGVLGEADALDAALANIALPGGRWREVDTGRHVFLDDAYNANPSSVLASFEAFMGWSPARVPPGGARAVVLGEMLELGEGAKSWHEEIAGCISEHSELTTLIAVGEYAEEMAAAAQERGHGGLIAHAARDVAQAAVVLGSMDPAIVFLKASRGARLELVIEQVQDGPASPRED
jgi:UDP-N-acetylmuramoyl-tripeptide--D-alanyl-D-alanine ligase